ncbi:MAG: sialate O-acetylesterase [Bacteroidales bacterium]|nr:sialate O-acetylesterase [Bacteroidales bacterium]MCB9013703.1 sialate O-acetylesterase [Bacteroidales bacterium]
MKNAVCLLLLFSLNVFSSNAEIRLPALISDGVILQRGKEIKLWGWADAGENISLSFRNKKFKTTADKEGKWVIMLPKQEAGGPWELSFKGKNEVRVQNVLFGDVWLCSGQSNMVLPMERVKEKYPQEIAASENDEIRNFFVERLINLEGPQDDFPSGSWKSANPTNVLGFSAVAYFFAKEIYEKYHIPIGLINSSVGGTLIEAWTSEDGLKQFPDILEVSKRNKNKSYIDSLIQNSPGPVQRTEKDAGLEADPKWYEESYIPKGWHNINIPGYWEDQGVKNLDGVVWYRRDIDVPAEMTGVPAKLFLGRIVDADVAYINGQEVGHISYQYPPRRYEIPAGVLKNGKNTIVIRVINTGGKGGFVPDKPYYLSANGQEIDLKGTWQYKVGEAYHPGSSAARAFSLQDQPTSLFNAMIAPATNFSIKGILWYQGESNTGNPGDYVKLFPALIHDWRRQWGGDDLPFLYVQLANYMDVNYLPDESKWAELRDAQLKTLAVPNTAMAVIIDLGEWNDVHPLNKRDVGYRLSLCAENLAYSEKTLEYMGPIYQSDKIEGNRITISFAHRGSGLVSIDGEPLYRFEIAGEDGKFVWAEAKITGDVVEVWNDNISNPKYVRYAWSDNPQGANLFSREGLPASPFRTDK